MSKTKKRKATGTTKPTNRVPSRRKGATQHVQSIQGVPPTVQGKRASKGLATKSGAPSSDSNGNGKAIQSVTPICRLPSLCQELQALQRQRAVYIKSRVMVSNRLQAIIAGTMGYHSGMKDTERQKVFGEAGKYIKAVVKGETDSPQRALILTHHAGIAEFERMQAALEKEMQALAKQLPVAEWAQSPDQRGFGLLRLAVVIGETGDLSNYANPAKVWRRMGCAPYTKDGKTAMGKTWRCGKEGKLHAEDWEDFGYSPRRRSIAYMIGELLLKLNDGPYRARYDETKARAAEKHPEWPKLRCHLHGMLLATKLLFKNLWIEWNP